MDERFEPALTPDREQQITLQLLIMTIVDELADPCADDIQHFALGTMMMDYFQFCELFARLQADGLIKASVRKDETRLNAQGRPLPSYDLTEDGAAVYDSISHALPIALRRSLLFEMNQMKKKRRYETEFFARYRADDNGHFDVHIGFDEQLRDHFSLKLRVPNEQEARTICKNWKEHPLDLHLQLLQLLLKPHPETSDAPSDSAP